MDISTLGASAGATTATPRNRGLSGMKSEDFFRILVSELQQQDPFKPAETADMINEVSQIRGIELSSQLNSTLDKFAQSQRASGAGDLIGKYVYAVSAAEGGESLNHEGVVTGVRFGSDGAAALELDSGLSVPIDDVVRVTEIDSAGATGKSLGLSELLAPRSDAAVAERAKGAAHSAPARWPLLSKLFG